MKTREGVDVPRDKGSGDGDLTADGEWKDEIAVTSNSNRRMAIVEWPSSNGRRRHRMAVVEWRPRMAVVK